MRKVFTLLLLVIMVSLSGCAELSLKALNSDGSLSDAFMNEHLEITATLNGKRVYVEVRNLTDESLVLFWPDGNISLPDGSVFTAGYLSSDSNKIRKYSTDPVTGIPDLDGPTKWVYKSMDNISGPAYVDGTPKSIESKKTEGFLLEIAGKPENPSEAGGGADPGDVKAEFMKKIGNLVTGDRIAFRTAYRLLDSDLAFDVEVVLQVTGR